MHQKPIVKVTQSKDLFYQQHFIKTLTAVTDFTILVTLLTKEE